MRSQVPAARAFVAGFVVAGALLVALVALVGVADVTAVLASTRPEALALLLGVAACWVVAWSHALHAVFGVLGVPSPRGRTVLVYATVQFANNVAPFSVAGGEPLAALFVARSTRTDFETSLAAVVSTDALNFVPGPALALLGLTSLLVSLEGGATAGTRLAAGRAAVAIAVTSLAILAVASLGWRRRHRLADRATGALVAVGRIASRLVPRLPAPTAAGMAERMDRLVTALERVLASPRRLLGGVAFATLGWLLLSGCLWVAVAAVGESVPFAVAAFVVPVANVTDLVPLPGGVGTLEPVIVLLLDVAGGVPLVEATAAVLVYRAATYWLPVAVGGGLVVLLAGEDGVEAK